MSEEKKKGGFWASLFGRNKKQEEQKIEPIIEEPSVEPADVSPEEEIVHAEENVQLEQVEQEDINYDKNKTNETRKGSGGGYVQSYKEEYD